MHAVGCTDVELRREVWEDFYIGSCKPQEWMRLPGVSERKCEGLEENPEVPDVGGQLVNEDQQRRPKGRCLRDGENQEREWSVDPFKEVLQGGESA